MSNQHPEPNGNGHHVDVDVDESPTPTNDVAADVRVLVIRATGEIAVLNARMSQAHEEFAGRLGAIEKNVAAIEKNVARILSLMKSQIDTTNRSE